jgi:hypothetical protein
MKGSKVMRGKYFLTRCLTKVWLGMFFILLFLCPARATELGMGMLPAEDMDPTTLL